MNRPSILVVDDHCDFLTLYKAMLGGQYDVIAVASVSEALSVLSERCISVVVTDLDMHPKSGVGLIECILANEFMATVPIIVCTAGDERRPFRHRERVSAVISKIDLARRLDIELRAALNANGVNEYS